jgi:integrase
MTRKRKLPKNVSPFIDRHGKERFRWRKTGYPTVYLKEPPGTEKNPSEEVKALVADARPAQPGAKRAVPGSVDDLVARFYESTAFSNGGADTKRVNRGILEAFRAEHGDLPVRRLTFEHIEAILTAKGEKRVEGKRTVGGKSAAFNLKKQLKRLFDHGVKLKMIPTNPVDLAGSVKVPKGGIHTWTEGEVAQFQARHPLGSKPRLALEIMLWTGQRRGDARLFGPGHVKGGRMRYVQGKTGKELWLPMAPALLAAISAMPAVGVKTYLVTEFGKPFSKAGFGNWFRDRCDEAGLPQCSAHGLRKAIARRMAESGAGNQGIKSVTGHSNDAEVALYTAEVDQARLAEQTLGRLFDLANPADPDLATPSKNG